MLKINCKLLGILPLNDIAQKKRQVPIGELDSTCRYCNNPLKDICNSAQLGDTFATVPGTNVIQLVRTFKVRA